MGDKAFDSPRPAGPIGLLRNYWRPMAVLCVAVPITGYALVCSLAWFHAPFPGFFLMENRVVPSHSGYSWPPDKAALFHSQVVAVDGQAVRSSNEVYRYVASRPVGTPIEYTLRKDGRVFQRTVPSMVFTTADYLQTCGVVLVFGCAWLGFGLVVGFLQPRKPQARVYLLQAFIAGLYPITGIFLHEPGFPWLTKVYFLFECFFPATWIQLALVFPVERRFTGLRRAWPLTPFLLSGLMSLLVLRGFYGDPPDLAAVHATYIYAALSFLFFVGGLAFAYWENREPQAQPRVKAVLPGALLAGTLAFFAMTNSAFAGRDFPQQFGLVFTPAFSACVAYAIAKHDLFDIDRVVRQSFVYALLSIIVISAYALLLMGSARLVPARTGESQALLGMAFVLVMALLLDPLRRGVQTVVDRAFYRTRFDYRATISELSAIMTTLLDLREIVAQVTRVVTEAMHLESTTVYLVDRADSTCWSRGIDGELRQRDADPVLATLPQLFTRCPHEFNAATLPERIEDPAARELVRASFTAAGISVVLPLMFRGQANGILILGRKQSGLAFSSDDVALLRTLANETAIAVQNARSYKALADLTRDLDAKVRERTEELQAANQELGRAYDELKSAEAQLVQSEKMASLGQLVAGVAHELNNPASFVHGGLANLEEYLQRFIEIIAAYERVPIADPDTARAIADVRAAARIDYLLRETPSLLRICAEGSERIKKIIDDLRVFVRADQGERVRTDITQGLDSALRLLGDRLARYGVAVTKDYREVPRIEADVGQLNQVWMNLLSNAIDAVEDRAAPEIRLVVRPHDGSTASADLSAAQRGDDDGAEPWVEVEVSDNGAGIPHDQRERIFDPFFTTKPPGRGTGLGLSIVYGAIKNHGGKIAVDSVAQQGTTVTVRLPLRGREAPSH